MKFNCPENKLLLTLSLAIFLDQVWFDASAQVYNQVKYDLQYEVRDQIEQISQILEAWNILNEI